MEESIKGFSGDILNADWEKLHYHNETLLFGNIVIIIWFFFFFFLFLNTRNDSFIPSFRDAGQALWLAIP